jgi:hypothetical protein
MHEMFNFNYKITSTNIYLNSRLNDEDHVLHPQTHYKQQTFDFFSWEKKYKNNNDVFEF